MPAAIERLLRTYLANHAPAENFRAVLAVGKLAFVARHPAPGRPPQGVDG